MSGYVGRLAPSPTGALHLGNVRTFMIAWLRARQSGGKVIFRLEDLDHPRDKPGAAAQAVEDLRWLGFDWDEEYVQSERHAVYLRARDALLRAGLLYPCVCSRREVERVQSAPHAGEQLHYPGICRGRFATWDEAAAVCPPCWRFRVDGSDVVDFDDVFAGHYEQRVSEVLGDFPVSRDEGGAGYTLAVVADDLSMGVTEVVRGDDLLAATPAQVLIARALIASGDSLFAAARLPEYCHVPLLVGPDGRRLAKRHGDTRIAAFREAGMTPAELLGILAASCGWARPGERVLLPDLVGRFTLATIPRSPTVVTGVGTGIRLDLPTDGS